MSVTEYKKHLTAFKTSKNWTDLIKNLTEIESDLDLLLKTKHTKLKKLIDKLSKIKLTDTTKENILSEIREMYVNDSNCIISYPLNPLNDPSLFLIYENKDFIKEEDILQFSLESTCLYETIRSHYIKTDGSNSTKDSMCLDDKLIRLPPYPLFQFRSHIPSFNYLIRRLNQCMNEHLPCGVHLKVLNIYNLLLNKELLNIESLNSTTKCDISLFKGLFNYGSVAKMSAKDQYLKTLFNFHCLLQDYEYVFINTLKNDLAKIYKQLDIKNPRKMIAFSSNRLYYTTFLFQAIIPLLHSSFEIDISLIKQIKGTFTPTEHELNFTAKKELFFKSDEDQKKALIFSYLYYNNAEFYSCFYRAIMNERSGRIGALKFLKDCIILEQQQITKIIKEDDGKRKTETVQEKNSDMLHQNVKYISPYMLPALEACLNDEDGFVQKGAFELLALILTENYKYKPELINNKVKIPLFSLNQDMIMNLYRFMCIKLDSKEHSTIQRILKLLDRELLFNLLYFYLINEEIYENIDFFTNIVIKSMATYSLYRDEGALEEEVKGTCMCGDIKVLKKYFDTTIPESKDEEGNKKSEFEKCKLINSKIIFSSLYLRHNNINMNSFTPLIMLNTTFKKNHKQIKNELSKYNENNQMMLLISSLGEEYVCKEILLHILFLYKKYENEKDSTEIVETSNFIIKSLYINILQNLFSIPLYTNMLIFFSHLFKRSLEIAFKKELKLQFFDVDLFTKLIIALCYNLKESIFKINILKENSKNGEINILLKFIKYLESEDQHLIEDLNNITTLEEIIIELVYCKKGYTLDLENKVKLLNFFNKPERKITKGVNKSIFEVFYTKINQENIFKQIIFVIEDLFKIKKYEEIEKIVNQIISSNRIEPKKKEEKKNKSYNKLRYNERAEDRYGGDNYNLAVYSPSTSISTEEEDIKEEYKYQEVTEVLIHLYNLTLRKLKGTTFKITDILNNEGSEVSKKEDVFINKEVSRFNEMKTLLRFILNIRGSYPFCIYFKEFVQKHIRKGTLGKSLLDMILNILYIIFEEMERGEEYRIILNTTKIFSIDKLSDILNSKSDKYEKQTQKYFSKENNQFFSNNSYLMDSGIFKFIPVLNLIANYILSSYDNQMEIGFISFINSLTNKNVLLRTVEYCFVIFKTEAVPIYLETKFSSLFVMINYLLKNCLYLKFMKMKNVFNLEGGCVSNCLIIKKLVMFLILSMESKSPNKEIRETNKRNEEEIIKNNEELNKVTITKTNDKTIRYKLHIMIYKELLNTLCINDILKINTLLGLTEKIIHTLSLPNRTFQDSELDEVSRKIKTNLLKACDIFKSTIINMINPNSLFYLTNTTEIKLSRDLKKYFSNINLDKIYNNSKLIEILYLSKEILIEILIRNKHSYTSILTYLEDTKEPEVTKGTNLYTFYSKEDDELIYHKIYYLLTQVLASLYENGNIEISGGIEKSFKYKYSELNTYNEFSKETEPDIIKTNNPIYYGVDNSDKPPFINKIIYSKLDSNKQIRKIKTNNLNMNFPLTTKIQLDDSFPFIREDRTCFIEIYNIIIHLYRLLTKVGQGIKKYIWEDIIKGKILLEHLWVFFPTDNIFNSLIQTPLINLFPTCYFIRNFKTLYKFILEKKVTNYSLAIRYIYRILVMQRIKAKEISFNKNLKFQVLEVSTELLQNIKELSAVECICCDAIVMNVVECEIDLLTDLNNLCGIDSFDMKNILNLFGTRISLYENAINKLLSNGDVAIQTQPVDLNIKIQEIISYESNLRILSYLTEYLKIKYVSKMSLSTQKDSNIIIFDNLKMTKGCEYNWYAKITKESFLIIKNQTNDIYNLNYKIILDICLNTQTCEKACSRHYGFIRENNDYKIISRNYKDVDLCTNIGHDCILINSSKKINNISISIPHREETSVLQKLYSLNLLLNEKLDFAPLFSFYFSTDNAILVKSKCIKKIALILLVNKSDTYINELKHLIRIISEGYKYQVNSMELTKSKSCNNWEEYVNKNIFSENSEETPKEFKCIGDCVCYVNKPDLYSYDVKVLQDTVVYKKGECIKIMNDNFLIPNNPNLLASILVLIRVMVIRYSPDKITNIWPVFYEIFYDILQNLIKTSPSLINYRRTGFMCINKDLEKDFIFKNVDWQIMCELLKTLDVILVKGGEIEHKMIVTGQFSNFYLKYKHDDIISELNTTSLLEILRIGLFNSPALKCVPIKKTLLIKNLVDTKQMSLYLQVAEDYYKKIECFGFGEQVSVHTELRNNKNIFEKEDEEITRIVCNGIDEYIEDSASVT